MSLSSERIYKRKPSNIVRQQLLQVLLRKYIKKVHFGALTGKQTNEGDQQQQQPQQHESNTTLTKVGNRQLLRIEYYNDIYECLTNYCKLNDTANGRLTKALDRSVTLTSRREFIESIKKKQLNQQKLAQETTSATTATKPIAVATVVDKLPEPVALPKATVNNGNADSDTGAVPR